MKITGFAAASYSISLAVGDRNIAITLPHDGFHYDEIMVRVYREHGVTLPFLTQSEWGQQLEYFIREAINRGEEIAPLSTVNKIVSGCEELTRKH